MEQMDERIAAWEREKKLEEKRKEETGEERGWDLETLRDGIKKGILKLPDSEEMKFSTVFCFAENIPLIKIEDADAACETNEDALLQMNPKSGTVQLIIHLPKDMEDIPLEVWRSNIERDLKRAGNQVRNFLTRKLTYMDYICYEVCEKNTWTYNLVYRIHKHNRRVMGNYNCMLNDKNTFGRLLEALLLESHEQLQRSDKV